MRTGRNATALALVLFVTAACRGVPEPGFPAADPSPLIDGYDSYRTLEEISAHLPDRSSWEIVFDFGPASRQAGSNDCPPMHEFAFDVPVVSLGQPGRLRLTFVNNRLESATFTPTDFEGYLHTLERRGLRFDAEGHSRLAPRTSIWKVGPHDGVAGYVSWMDTQLRAQVSDWEAVCAGTDG